MTARLAPPCPTITCAALPRAGTCARTPPSSQPWRISSPSSQGRRQQRRRLPAPLVMEAIPLLQPLQPRPRRTPRPHRSSSQPPHPRPRRRRRSSCGATSADLRSRCRCRPRTCRMRARTRCTAPSSQSSAPARSRFTRPSMLRTTSRCAPRTGTSGASRPRRCAAGGGGGGGCVRAPLGHHVHSGAPQGG